MGYSPRVHLTTKGSRSALKISFGVSSNKPKLARPFSCVEDWYGVGPAEHPADMCLDHKTVSPFPKSSPTCTPSVPPSHASPWPQPAFAGAAGTSSTSRGRGRSLPTQPPPPPLGSTVRPLVDALFTCHPSSLEVPAEVQGIKVPVAVAVGTDDKVITPPQQAVVQRELKDAEVECEVRIYEGAGRRARTLCPGRSYGQEGREALCRERDAGRRVVPEVVRGGG
ncbi:MAG: hypothetical protein MMC33_010434 [Icmadophila ericetorum]|nr:hypothetical protein [Icmadophila ericetorum]